MKEPNCSSVLFVYKIVTCSMSNCFFFHSFHTQDSRWRRPGRETLCFLEETLPSFVRIGQPAVCVASKSLLIPAAVLARLASRVGGEITLI